MKNSEPLAAELSDTEITDLDVANLKVEEASIETSEIKQESLQNENSLTSLEVEETSVESSEIKQESLQNENSLTSLENDLDHQSIDYKTLAADTSVLDWSFVQESDELSNVEIEKQTSDLSQELIQDKNSPKHIAAESSDTGVVDLEEEQVSIKPLDVKPLGEKPVNVEQDASSLALESLEGTDDLTESLDKPETQPIESKIEAETISTAKPANLNEIENSSIVETNSSDFTILPLGVNIGTRNALESTLAKGYEDGTQAINLDQWLIPFNDLVSAFNLKVQPLEDGQLELRSPFIAKIINPEEFAVDSEIGMAISVDQIKTIFDTTTEFSLEEYALILNPPWLNKRAPKDRRLNTFQRQISLEGLPEVKAPLFSFTSIGQQTNFSGSGDETDSSGELVGIGSTMGGSWLFRVDQNDLTQFDSWQLDDAQFLRQTPQFDYVLGIQPTFWNSQGSGDLTGLTTIKRWGFNSPYGGSSGDFSVNQRLRSDRNLRTIAGEAEPGTLVQLVTTVGNTVIDEVFVDSSGIYRFEDIATSLIGFKGVTSIGNNYRVLLYEDGDLTREPETRSVNFANLPGQLSKGTSALVASVGVSRSQGDDFIGKFSGLKGGASYRWGARENLTLGLGAVYDESALGLTEVFYQPNSSIQLRASALIGGEEGLDYTANLRYEPSSTITLNLDTDELSSRVRANWRANKELSLSLNADTSDSAIGGGISWGRNIKDLSLRTGLSIDTNSNLRWNLYSSLDDFTLRHRGNEVSTNTELTYELGQNGFDSKKSDLTLGLDTNDDGDRLLSLDWQYTPGTRTKDNRVPWRFGLGYGLSSAGQGIRASASTGIVPGLDLQARYDNISLSSNESRFSLNLSPSLFLQPKLRPGSRNLENLRTQGGLFIQPFLDRNGNGKKDKQEKFYNEDLDFLLLLNEQPLNRFTVSKPDIRQDGLLANLFPGKYRLDLDPAGYPVGWKATETAFAIDIAAGSYTTVTVPLIPSYILAGTATQNNDEVISGARIEAVSLETGLKYFTVTNGVGSFYLENIPQGNYELFVNGNSVRSGDITLNEKSETFQEINLQIN